MKPIPQILIFLLLFAKLALAQNIQLVDSLKQELPSLQGKEKVMTLCNICYELKYQDAEEARKYCREALDLAQKNKDKKGKATALQYLGVSYQGQSNYTESLKYQEESLKLYQELEDTLAIANVQNNIGIVFDEKGDYKKAIERYFLALKIYEQRKDQLGIAQAYNNIGIVYKKQKNYKKVIEYYQKALSIYQNHGHGFGVAVCQGNLGSIFLNTENYQKAIEFSLLSISGYDSLDVRQFKPYPLGNIGRAYNGLKEYDKAIDYHLAALQLHEKYGNKKEIAFTKNNLAEAYMQTGRDIKAKQHSQESLASAIDIGAKEEIRNAYLTLSKIYEKEKDFKKAYQAYLNYSIVKDSLFETEKTNTIAELQTKYETAQKEQTIQVQQFEIEKAETQNRIITSTAIAGLIGLILLGMFGYFYYKNKQEALQGQKELDYQQQLIVATVEATEEERKRIAQDLHDGVGQQLTGLKMNWQRFANNRNKDNGNTQEVMDRLTKILDEVMKDVRTISHRMMPKSLSEFGLVAALEDMLEKSFRASGIRYSFDSIGIQNRFEEKVELAVFRITQELINNALKHSEAKDVVVQLYQTKDKLILSVEDNGKGFQLNKVSNKGHGLMNIQSRAKSLSAEIFFEQNNDTGLITTLRVPV